MPELSAIHVALMVAAALVGVIAGWILRGQRAEQEKAAVSAGWQEQIDAQRREGGRLLDQNKGLMEQVSQFQASHNDAKNRAKELSGAVQEAYARRDELQREIKDIRSNLEVAVSERDQLQSDMAARSSTDDVLREKDARIEKLTQELENWQNRLPPLIERFRARNEEAEELQAALEDARERIRELETLQSQVFENPTRIEPVTNPEHLTDGLDASNDEDTGTPEPEADDDVDGCRPEQEMEPETDGHDPRDDLQRIKGVGPAIEKTLNEMGIVSFRQIADMSEYDIDRVARRLKGFRTRIYREDWIGQARELRDQAVTA
jgi:predicted flap endonuclease-1-like 5' DNA nuclease/peptidoglycan hydrolase CwlO-like protein